MRTSPPPGWPNLDTHNHLGTTALLTGSYETSSPITEPGAPNPPRTFRIYDVLLSNVRLDLAAGGEAAVSDPASEYNGDYPEAWNWRRLKPYGYYVRHVDGLTMRDVRATARRPGGGR